MAAAAFLSNATIVRTLPLQFPAYGFEGIFHRPPPPETPKPGSHFQHTLRISGTVPPGSSFSRYHLKVDMFVRGALWRTQTHALCSSINDDPEDEVLRRCASGDGPFTAMVWAFVPSNRPSFEEGEMGIAQGVRLLRQAGRDHAAQLRVATHYLARMNVCNLSQPLPDRFVGAECNKSLSKLLLAHADGTQPMRHTKGKVTPDALMRSYAWKHDPRGGKSDLYDVDWRTIGTMFVLAALSLPQPFAIVENGNFCGGTSGFIALLKRELCPQCTYVSLDPGLYRVRRHARMSCNVDSLTYAGLEKHVTFIDQPSAALAALEQPVGFMYVDGGKVRFCNEPLHATLEDKMMVGALVGLDDIWQGWPNAPHAREHLGQISFVHEKVMTGDWQTLVVPAGHFRVGQASKGKEMITALKEEGERAGGPTNDVTRKALFPENVKQALIVKSRSRFEQPGERDGTDALRVTLVARGGTEVAPPIWIPIPAVTTAQSTRAAKPKTER